MDQNNEEGPEANNTVPNQIPAANTNPNQVPAANVNLFVRSLTIREAFSNQLAFQQFLLTAGLGIREVNNLIFEEGVNSFSTMLNFFPTTMSFETFIKDINKTFGGRQGAARIYYNIRIKKCLTAAHFYVYRCMLINKIPDIRLLNLQFCITYLEENYDRVKDKIEDDNKIKLPDFKQGEDWITFRDKFTELLASTIGKRGISMKYVIRTTDDNAEGYVEQAIPDVTDESIFDKETILRGAPYKEDNKYVYNVLSKHLLGTSGQNYIDQFKNTRDSRAA